MNINCHDDDGEDYYIAHSLILAGVDKLHENQLLHVFMKDIL